MCRHSSRGGGKHKWSKSPVRVRSRLGGGCDRDCYGKKAGKGALIQWEKSGTLGVSQDQTLFVWSTQYKGGRDINRERK